MIYFIFGNQSSTVKSQIKKIAATFLGDIKPDDFNFVKIDGHNNVVQEAVNECKYVALGYDKKVVSLENCYFLMKPKPRNKIESEQDYKALKEYIANEYKDDSCAFIMSVITSELDKKNELVPLIIKNTNIIEIKDPDEKSFAEYTRSYCEKHNIKIDRDALYELTAATSGDVADFKNSIAKLTLYTDHIRLKDVIKMVPRKLEDKSYMISSALIEGNNVEAIKIYRDLLVYKTEPVRLISQIANQFRLINQVRYLLKVQKLSQEEVAKELNIKPGRVYGISKNFAMISEKAVINALEELYQLDFKIKSGQVNDRFYAFEMFLLKFKRN